MIDESNNAENPTRTLSFTQKHKQKRLRFNIEDDLRLLREVCSRNPYQDPTRWKVVQQNVASHGKAYSLRCIKEHLEHLLKLYVKNDMENLYKVGTHKQLFEKTTLLEEIKRMQTSVKGGRQFVISQSEIVQNSMNIVSFNSCSKIGESDATTEHLEEVDIKPPTIMLAHNDMMGIENDADSKGSYILSRHVSPSESCEDNDIRRRQLDIEERQLALEERKLALDEKRFEIEREERLRRLDLETKEREARIKLDEQQQEIIKILLSQYKRN